MIDDMFAEASATADASMRELRKAPDLFPPEMKDGAIAKNPFQVEFLKLCLDGVGQNTQAKGHPMEDHLIKTLTTRLLEDRARTTNGGLCVNKQPPFGLQDNTSIFDHDALTRIGPLPEPRSMN